MKTVCENQFVGTVLKRSLKINFYNRWQVTVLLTDSDDHFLPSIKTICVLVIKSNFFLVLTIFLVKRNISKLKARWLQRFTSYHIWTQPNNFLQVYFEGPWTHHRAHRAKANGFPPHIINTSLPLFPCLGLSVPPWPLPCEGIKSKN